MSEDEIIGLKSTSVKFKKNIKFFVGTAYSIFTILIIFLFKDELGINLFSAVLMTFIGSLCYQVLKFKKNNPKNCLKMFKLNNYSGFLLLTSILLKY